MIAASPGTESRQMRLDKYQPTKSRVLVKVSAVNCCADELQATSCAENLKKCLFVRVVLVGPSIQNPEKIRPGSLVLIKKNAGIKLSKLSRLENQEYRIIKESHVVAYADF